jgi:hypothetical protein
LLVRTLKHTVNKVLSLRDKNGKICANPLNLRYLRAIKNDVRPFIKNPSEMDIWSTDYFLQLVDRINFKI